MPVPPSIRITCHDDLPAAETALVDAGLGASNDAAAPLHEVRPLSNFVRLAGGLSARIVRYQMVRTLGSGAAGAG
jgi:hypothetical protein